MDGISVVVCCYNSATKLPNTIKCLAQQKVKADVSWEILIIDNNSNDDTRVVANNEWNKYNLYVFFAVIEEKIPGLSFAREKGILNSKYDLIIFCDDDNWLNADYIQKAYDEMHKDPSIGILGGLNTPVANGSLPTWFQKFEYAYACGTQANTDGEIPKDKLYVTGAGMVIRREIFETLKKVNSKSQLLDRKGEELSSGGDAELGHIAAILGYKLVYHSGLKLQHFMEQNRLTWNYFLRLNKGHAQSYYILLFYKRLYNEKSINISWFKFAAEEIGLSSISELITLVYQYYFKSKQQSAIGDAFSIRCISKVEIFKTHLRFVGKYSDLALYFSSLKENIIAYKKQLTR